MKAVIKRIMVILVFCVVIGGFAAIAYVISQLQNPEVQLEELLIDADKRVAQALFTPDDDVKSVLISLIKSEKKRILSAIFTITDKDIAQAFVAAYERGVAIEFVVDRGYAAEKYSKVPYLANSQIPVWVYQSGSQDTQDSLMHDKFCIFEENIAQKPLIWTGSYNFTKRASTRNQENVIILDNQRIIDRFREQFNKLKSRSLVISGKVGATYTHERTHDESLSLNMLKKWVRRMVFGFPH